MTSHLKQLFVFFSFPVWLAVAAAAVAAAALLLLLLLLLRNKKSSSFLQQPPQLLLHSRGDFEVGRHEGIVARAVLLRTLHRNMRARANVRSCASANVRSWKSRGTILLHFAQALNPRASKPAKWDRFQIGSISVMKMETVGGDDLQW